eukprot:scaffold6056_cov71-Cyclotella_meneghiniana.AAC.1
MVATMCFESRLGLNQGVPALDLASYSLTGMLRWILLLEEHRQGTGTKRGACDAKNCEVQTPSRKTAHWLKGGEWEKRLTT